MKNVLCLLSVCGAVLVGCSGAAAPATRLASLPAGLSPDVGPTYRLMPTVAPRGSTGPLRYVALGDSYTIGTSVKQRDRWPNQLIRGLRPDPPLELVDNLATSGATSADLIRDQLPSFDELRPGFASVLIGVNDVVKGVDAGTYRDNLTAIFGHLLTRVAADRIVVVTTPDYTLTPRGADYGARDAQHARILDFNSVLMAEAKAHGVAYVDIAAVADTVTKDATLVAPDGLHPSAKQYAGWVELIASEVRDLLKVEP